MGHQRPHNARVLVGQRHRSHVLVAPRKDASDPTAGVRLCSLALPVNHRTCTVDQQGAQVGVTPFADPQQVLLTPTGMLARH